jgi:hypothetical protein
MANEELWLALKADITDVQNQLNNITSQGKQAASTMGTDWSRTALQIGSALGIAFSTRAIVNFAKQSISAFADSEESAMILANTLKNIGISDSGIKSIEGLVSNLEKTKFFEATEIRQSLVNVVTKLGDTDLAMKTVTTAMEVARAKGLSLSDVVQRISLGFMGNSKGLRDLGINIKDYNAETMNAATETQILNDILVKFTGSTEAFGETTKGSLATATTAWHDFRIEVGKTISPVIKPVTSEISGFLRSVTESLKWFGETGKRVSETHPLGNIVTSQTVQVVTDLKNGLQEIGPAASAAGDAIKSAFEPLWKPITLQGGNLPELSRFVGNLRYAPVITKKMVIDVNVNDTSKIPTAVSKAVVSAIRMGGRGAIEAGMPYESHGTGGGGG